MREFAIPKTMDNSALHPLSANGGHRISSLGLHSENAAGHLAFHAQAATVLCAAEGWPGMLFVKTQAFQVRRLGTNSELLDNAGTCRATLSVDRYPPSSRTAVCIAPPIWVCMFA